MKKSLLGAVALVGLVAMATSASAADMAARPYTKAPPPMVAAIYDWSGFYLGLNGGWGSARKCWDLTEIGGFGLLPAALHEGCHDASGGTVGGQIGTAGRPVPGCSAWKLRATGLISKAPMRPSSAFLAGLSA